MANSLQKTVCSLIDSLVNMGARKKTTAELFWKLCITGIGAACLWFEVNGSKAMAVIDRMPPLMDAMIENSRQNGERIKALESKWESMENRWRNVMEILQRNHLGALDTKGLSTVQYSE